MVTVNGIKFACDRCIRGHRVSGCKHIDSPLRQVKKKGRPPTQCASCRKLRPKGYAANPCCAGGQKYSSDLAHSDRLSNGIDFTKRQTLTPEEIAELRKDPSVKIQLPDGTLLGPGDLKIPPSEQNRYPVMEIRFEHPGHLTMPHSPDMTFPKSPHAFGYYGHPEQNLPGGAAGFASPMHVRGQPFMEPHRPHHLQDMVTSPFDHSGQVANSHPAFEARESPSPTNEDELLASDAIRYKKNSSHKFFPAVESPSENNSHSARLNARGDNDYAPNTGTVVDPADKLALESDMAINSEELADSLSGLEPKKTRMPATTTETAIDAAADPYSTASPMKLSNLY